jgi:hypothetical protein
VGLNPLKKSSGTATEAVTIAPSEHTRDRMVSGFHTHAQNKNGVEADLRAGAKKSISEKIINCVNSSACA